MAIPSQVRFCERKGVETERQASANPPAGGADEETVRTTNSKEATKVVAVRITDWS
jgi:hypothetical protein